MAALTPKIAASSTLDSQAVSNVLTGLELHDGTSAEVRAFLAALVPKLRECPEPLRAQEVGSALHGLRTFGDSDEVRSLLTALTPLVAECEERLTVEHLSRAVCGLRSLGDSPEKTSLATVLRPRLLECDTSELDTIKGGVYC